MRKTTSPIEHRPALAQAVQVTVETLTDCPMAGASLFRSRGIRGSPTALRRSARTGASLVEAKASIGPTSTRTSAWRTCSMVLHRGKANGRSDSGSSRGRQPHNVACSGHAGTSGCDGAHICAPPHPSMFRITAITTPVGVAPVLVERRCASAPARAREAPSSESA